MNTDIDGKSLDVKAEKLAQLKRIFPEFFSEEKIDLKRIKELLTDDEITDSDRYELSWAGKAEARREIQKQTSATLLPDKTASSDFDASKNVFIDGENLEVLRVLQKSYFGQVKLIYIDPPYNTGNDSFVYPDDFTERKSEYEKRSGQKNEEGYLNKQDLFRKNVKENGQYHSVWLSMMYPRLYLARNLLREDGVIFVSIDDNESHNLKLLMNEIFGEENFVANVIWEKKFAPSNDAKWFSDNHDHILVYAKNRDSYRPIPLKRSEEAVARYKNPDNDPRGVWVSGDMTVKTYNAQYDFPITTPAGREVTPPAGVCWRFSKKKVAELIADNRVWFGEGGDNVPRLKRFLTEVKDGVTPLTIWYHKDVGHNQEAAQECRKLFDGKQYFDTPKPTRLIKRMIELSMEPNAGDIVLDFFSGSGTTAHAVLDANATDGGNRRFICVQLAEPSDPESDAFKDGYKTIADVCRARIFKVIDRLKETAPGADLGFRSYNLSYSNFRKWDDSIDTQEELLQQLEIFKHPLARRPENSYVLLVELLLKAGLSLTSPVEEKKTSDGAIYYIVDQKLVFVFDKISSGLLPEIESIKPSTLIVLSSLFEGEKADELMNNWKLQLEEAGIEFKKI